MLNNNIKNNNNNNNNNSNNINKNNNNNNNNNNNYNKTFILHSYVSENVCLMYHHMEHRKCALSDIVIVVFFLCVVNIFAYYYVHQLTTCSII